MSTDPQVWIGVLVTIGILSVLFKENIYYRFLEYTMVGMAAAHALATSWCNTTKPLFRDSIIGDGEYLLLLPAVVGLLYYTRFLGPRLAWLSRYPVSLALGYGIGYALAYNPRPFLVQIRGVFSSFSSINDFVGAICFLATLYYFIFTLGKADKVSLGINRYARYVMMMFFGVSFANVIQGRMSLLLGRILFLVQDWLGLTLLQI